MQIKLKSLHIENFKGIKLLDVNFAGNTKIKGQNAKGKTTVFDAFTWVLFGKNSAGEEKFNIRPLDESGKRVDNVEIKVVAVLDVNGKEVELSKTQKQKWVKKRGTGTAELQGNENLYSIDGYPKSEKDYKVYISELIEEELFKMLTNPRYFVGLKWKDQRDILMKLVTDLSDVEFAKECGDEFADLIIELERAGNTDDIRNKFTKALNEWKKKQAEIPVRIDELSKSIVDIDVAELELAKNDLERKIANVEVKIKDAGSATATLREAEMRLQFDMSGIMQTMNRELSGKRSKVGYLISDKQLEVEDAKHRAQESENRLVAINKELETLDARKPEINKKWTENIESVFDDTPYLFDESKWKFDESSTVCSLCGQALQEDKINQLETEFEVKKAKAKADAESALNEAKHSFEEAKKQKKAEINEEVRGIREKEAALKGEKENLEKQLEESVALAKKAISEKENLEKQLEELPEKADYTQNSEYVNLKAKHDHVCAEIAKVDSKSHDELMTQFDDEKSNLLAELDAVKAEIAKAGRNIEIEERIEELKNEQKDVSQKVADQERMIFLLEAFIKKKMLRISESINSKFNTVEWKLFDKQINNGMKECCECMVKGVPYSGLNNAHRIIAGLDIINSLSHLYGAEAPIFVDNAEAINDSNLPSMGCQMVLLTVSDDKDLKVEGI